MKDQIPMECMDCGRRYLGPKPGNAPVNAVLYVGHCGCWVPHTVGAPYYKDANGKRLGPAVKRRAKVRR